MTEKSDIKNWRLEIDEERIAWLYFDVADSRVNILSTKALEELDILVNEISDEKPQGLIILSSKSNGFIAGADIKEFTKPKESSESVEGISKVQSLFNRIENLPFPTVSLIHGFCLGGGLELALACNYRVAEDSTKTRLGLPEVKLGIHPGFGGTVRLPKLVGTPAAMDIMLTGRTLDAYKAKKVGLVDFVEPERHLKTRARLCVFKPTPARKPSLTNKTINHSLIRPFFKKYLIQNVKKKASITYYPAPYAIIDLWAEHMDDPQTMLIEEAYSVAGLITSPAAQNLIRVFFLSERLKSLGRGADFKAGHVHVIGAGTMGGDIAAWCALNGLKATLQDREPKYIAPAIKRAYALYKKRIKKPRLIQAAMDRLIPDISGSGLSCADVIIEAIFEDIDIKKTLFKEIEPLIRPDALLTTNTSSIPLEELRQALAKPERLVGIHFFNPVAKMPLVEVVSGENTDLEVAQKATAFTGQINRLPLPVKSSPGFLVNRILMPYLLEAFTMVDEGLSPQIIDKAAVEFGMPMGPILLADTVGLDVCLHAAKIMSSELGTSVPESIQKTAASGNLGKKSGRGFYRYKKGKQIALRKFLPSTYPKDITDRLILRMVNEAVSCLNEGVVEDSDLLDAGMIFGTGFAPFRGGPIKHCKDNGVDEIIKRLKELEESCGESFKPDPGWGKIFSN